MGEKTEVKKTSEVKSGKINNLKCCRCVSRKQKICSNKKSKHYKQYVARKCTCDCFKYRD